MNKARQLSSLMKILLNYRKKKTVLDTMPIRLWIEPTNNCNLRCVMCLAEKISPAERGYMDFGLFKKIIDEARGYVYDVYLHHRGEPLLHPQFSDMVRYARAAGLRVKFHTNATLLDRERTEQILDARPELISFSFDGFTKEVYERIRVNARFDKTIENISGFLAEKKKRDLRYPYTVLEEIEFPDESDNPEARKEFADRFRTLGLDELVFKKLYNWAGDLETDDNLDRSRAGPCTFLWYSSVILWDGTVTPCPQDFFGRLKMGSVSERGLSRIWNDAPYQNLRGRMADLDGFEPCCRCDRIYRKRVGGVPFQYLISFFNDHIVGYGRLRRLLGSYERNE